MRNAVASLLRRAADRMDGRWEGLPTNLQLRAAIQAIQLRAWSCATTVRIARISGDRETSYNTASGVLIDFPERAVIATAWHVLDEFRKSRAAGQDVVLVIDNLAIERPRTVFRDERNDLAFIHVPSRGFHGISAVPYRPGRSWPAPRVKVNDAILICGFPRRFRYDGDDILHGDFSLVFEVDSAADSHFMLNVDWTRVGHAGRLRMPAHQVDYGGVSGGPAFLWDGGANPLVGIVSEATQTLPLWRISAFAGLNVDLETSPLEEV